MDHESFSGEKGVSVTNVCCPYRSSREWLNAFKPHHCRKSQASHHPSMAFSMGL